MLLSELLAIVIFYGIFGVHFCIPIPDDGSDSRWECRKFDFNSIFNITAENKIIVVFNSALCRRCPQKLLAFKALQLRFEIADYNDITFIMLTTEHYGTTEFDELQSKAGDILVLSLHDIDNDFFVAGSVYVFDKCARLTYELIPPWSEMQYQLVKAAILSTWYDTPCGECQSDSDELIEFIQYEDMSTTTINTENVSTELVADSNSDYDDYKIQIQNNDSEYVINLRTIMPLTHIHHLENDTYLKYNYIILKSNNTSAFLHDHISSDQTEELYDDRIKNSINSSTSCPPEYLRNSEGLRFKVTITHPLTNSSDDTTNSYQEVQAVHDVVVVTPPAQLTNSYLGNAINSSMLATLKPWLSFRLLSRV